jgi:hypothetical protein
MKTRWTQFRAWWLRLVYRKRLMKMDLETEPKLFYVVILTVAGSIGSTQEYIYVGQGRYLPTSKSKKKNHFLTISL